MAELRDLDVDLVMSRAALALSKVSGAPVNLDSIHVLSDGNRRNFIGRARSRSGIGPSQSVIVKATRSPTYDPAHQDTLENSGLVKEWVATAFIAARAPGRGHGPALLAGEKSSGILVFEDFGADLQSLVDPLLAGTAGEAELALKQYATVLARLHADTVGCAEHYDEMFRTVFGIDRPQQTSGR